MYKGEGERKRGWGVALKESTMASFWFLPDFVTRLESLPLFTINGFSVASMYSTCPEDERVYDRSFTP